jgi:hypothetical protein
MPHFYNHENTADFGRIIVTPKQWYRRIKIGSYSIWPYVTMGFIEFSVQIEKVPAPINNSYYFTVVERSADNSFKNVGILNNTKVDIKGRAEYTGDIKFLVGRSDTFPHSVEQRLGITLFADNVLSMNHYVWGGCSVAALLLILCSVLMGLLSGLIQVTPERVIWWPW